MPCTTQHSELHSAIHYASFDFIWVSLRWRARCCVRERPTEIPARWDIPSTHCTVLTSHCTLHTSHYTLDIVHYTLPNWHCALNYWHFTLHIEHCSIHTAQLTSHTKHWTLEPPVHTSHFTIGSFFWELTENLQVVSSNFWCLEQTKKSTKFTI